MHEAKQQYFPAIIVVILVGLMIALAQVISIGPSVILGLLGSWLHSTPLVLVANLLFVAGLFVSLILTSRWTIFYIMAPYANVIDGVQKKAALTKSASLVRGKFWSVLLRVVLPKFVFLLFGLFAATLISLLVQLIVQGSVGLNLDLAFRINTLVEQILPLLVTIFLNPLILLSDVLLYRNLTSEAT
jgi:hypothetical protein